MYYQYQKNRFTEVNFVYDLINNENKADFY